MVLGFVHRLIQYIFDKMGLNNFAAKNINGKPNTGFLFTATVVFMILLVWSTVTQVKSGSVMDVETPLEGMLCFKV